MKQNFLKRNKFSNFTEKFNKFYPIFSENFETIQKKF